ncbi:uncharacterized protein LOC112093051 [Morus notabilis]|uniref:uncharacterized protein LOC112093051 n=1 Tax=Morus notabilis TaxID=981085 RepID=UPI000CED701B|nr:uncharacterized protein LOC112093051 [Morus notabilis]
MVEESKEMKSQITKLTGALAVQERGKFPSQAQSNPKGQHMAQTSCLDNQNVKEVNAISTRSGKIMEEPSTSATTSSSKEVVPEKDEPTNVPVKVPFPQALRPTGKIPEHQSEILEHLTQVKINLSLLHVIKQVPIYAKVIKDLCIIKRKHHVKKTTFLTEQVTAVIDQKTPLKYKDLGCPIIPCQIRTHEFSQALLDLGLADRSIKKPRGIVEDVLVQVDKFYYPIDFLVLDTQSVVSMESKIPIILGRPFLATANALINCRNSLMMISFGNMTLEVNVFHIAKQPRDDDECHQTFLIDTLVSEEVQLCSNSDDLDDFLRISESESFGPCELANNVNIFKDSQCRGTKF